MPATKDAFGLLEKYEFKMSVSADKLMDIVNKPQ
jgi:hypothetical protein